MEHFFTYPKVRELRETRTETAPVVARHVRPPSRQRALVEASVLRCPRSPKGKV